MHESAPAKKLVVIQLYMCGGFKYDESQVHWSAKEYETTLVVNINIEESTGKPHHFRLTQPDQI